MTVSFAVLNAKGGVGKTTTAVNVAAMAATLPRTDGKSRRVLICDLDAQMNATHQLGFPDVDVNQTLAGHVTRDADLDSIIIRDAATVTGLDLLPSHYQLSYIDEAVLMTGTWLRRKQWSKPGSLWWRPPAGPWQRRSATTTRNARRRMRCSPRRRGSLGT